MTAFRVVNVDCNFGYAYERERLGAAGIELIERPAATEDEIIAACAEADAVLVEGAKTPITARVIAGLPRCRLIAKYAVGVDNVDLPAATAAGIIVANAADYCTEEVSDHTAALLLAGARRVVALDRQMQNGVWRGPPPAFPVRRLSQLTLGLIGLGRIARATGRKMAAFHLRILAADPYLPAGAREPGVEIVALERLLAESDLVSVHVPLTAQTRGMIGEACFRAMKPNAFFVNTSRGPVVNEAALTRALQEKWIAGAGLDVFEVEPLAAGSPLRGMPQVILTPHIGADSTDALQQARQTVVDSVLAVQRGKWPPFPVNPQVARRP